MRFGYGLSRLLGSVYGNGNVVFLPPDGTCVLSPVRNRVVSGPLLYLSTSAAVARWNGGWYGSILCRMLSSLGWPVTGSVAGLPGERIDYSTSNGRSIVFTGLSDPSGGQRLTVPAARTARSAASHG